jgi:hypothetical protein
MGQAETDALLEALEHQNGHRLRGLSWSCPLCLSEIRRFHPEYVCSRCGAEHCKLWRQYQTFLNHIELLCAKCAASDQKASLDGMNRDGLRHRWIDGQLCGETDQIGNLVPAVPTPADDTFWGYTSIPEEGVSWWRSLPTFPLIRSDKDRNG